MIVMYHSYVIIYLKIIFMLAILKLMRVDIFSRERENEKKVQSVLLLNCVKIGDMERKLIISMTGGLQGI